MQPSFIGDFSISLLGELRVSREGRDIPLPASRKTRALLAFLVATGRPHRRERLCELFWDIPDDPKAALRWSLSKLRSVVDEPDRPRIVADRERVSFAAAGASIDIREIHARLRQSPDDLDVATLEDMARRLDAVLLDGLDAAGDDAFLSWLQVERDDAALARAAALRLLATHPDLPAIAAPKWLRLWREADPDGAEAHEAEQAEAAARPPAPAAPPAFAPPPFGAPSPAPEPATASGPAWIPSRIAKNNLRDQRIGFCAAEDGAQIAYATVGEGAPVLKAANWLSHLEFDWTSPIWGRCFAELARDRCFVRYDERGCGLSDWDVDDLTFDAFVMDLETVADELGLERFPLLGISQGAAVSIEYAVRHPERVSGLILIGGYAAGWRHTASPEEQARREAVRALTEVGWGTENPAYRHIFSQTFMPGADAGELAWFDEFQRLTTSPRNAARFQDAFGEIDVRHRLSAVRAPTLVLHSDKDQRIPLSMGRALADGIPGAHFTPLDSRNHVLVDYEPAWRVCVETINAFMRHHRL